MNDKVFKIIKYLLYAMMGLGLLAFIYFLVMSILRPEPAPGYPIGTVGQAMGTDVMLIYTYILFAVALVVALVFPIINIIKNPKQGKQSLIGLAAIIVIVGISFLFANSDSMVLSDGKVFDNKFWLMATDIELISAYIMLVGTLLIIVGTEIWGSLKK